MEYKRFGVCAAAVAMWSSVLLTGCTGHAPPPTPAVPRSALAAGGPDRLPNSFIALRVPALHPASSKDEFEGVALNDSRTGHVIRGLLPRSRHGMPVAGLSLDPAGGLWVTYSRGPTCSSGVAGCGPKPHTCAGELDHFDLATGAMNSVMRTGADLRVANGLVSPDGRELVYQEAPCVPSYFNEHLRVRDLATGRSWTIGAGLPRCHVLTANGWSRDSHSLYVDYAAASELHYTGSDGTCPGWAAQHLEVLPASEAQSGVHGTVIPPETGCELQGAAGAAAGGVVAIEACGGNDYLDGPARLVVFDAHFAIQSSLPLGSCTDGNDIASDQSGRHWILSAYLYCARAAPSSEPTTRTWTYDGNSLRPVTTVTGGTLSVGNLTW